MMRYWRAWLALLLIATLGGACALPWQSQGTEAETSSLTQVVTVERGDLTASVSPTGEVYAPRQVQLSFDVTRLPLIELHVVAGQQVMDGDVLARVEPDSLERAVEQAEADVLSAQEALEAAQSPAGELDLQRARLSVTQAETALEQARENLADLQVVDTTSAERAVGKAAYELENARLNLTLVQNSTAVNKAVRDAEYAVDWHERKARDVEAQFLAGTADQDDVDDQQAALADAQSALQDARQAAADALEAAQTRIGDAREALTKAGEALADLQAGPTGLEIAQAEDQVAAAEVSLARAQDDLASLEAGPDAKEVELAQARYDAAQADLEEARDTLEGATMVAPFDGTIVSVGAEVGDLVSSGQVIVTLADLNRLEVLASVDETDISQVEVGRAAQITFDAFPGRTFQGQVLEVPLEGRLSQSIVTYEVPVSLEGWEGVALKSGMTANLAIIVGQRENALLVPLLAVQQGDTGDVVLVQDAPGAAAVEVPVEVGVSDGVYVEVLRGLNEGDQVVVQYDTSQQTTGLGFGRNQGGGLMGGAMRFLP